jgi:hypothetical protein
MRSVYEVGNGMPRLSYGSGLTGQRPLASRKSGARCGESTISIWGRRSSSLTGLPSSGAERRDYLFELARFGCRSYSLRHPPRLSGLEAALSEGMDAWM